MNGAFVTFVLVLSVLSEYYPAVLHLLLSGSSLAVNKLADEYLLILTGQGKNGAGGVVVAH